MNQKKSVHAAPAGSTSKANLSPPADALTCLRPSARSDQPAAGENEILTKKELAARLKVGVRSIESWQADELIPSFKVRGVLRFYWPAVLEKLNTNFRFCRRGVTAPLVKGGNP